VTTFCAFARRRDASDILMPCDRSEAGLLEFETESRRASRTVRVAAALVVFFAAPVASQPPVPATEVVARYRIESPDNSSPTWRDERLEWRHRPAPREVLVARAARVERFGREDTAYLLAGAGAVDARTTGYAELEGSERHSYLPRDGVYGQMRREFADGWGVSGGLRHRRYSMSKVDIVTGAVDRTVGTFRVVFAVTRSHSNAARNGGTRRAQLIRFYGQGSMVQGSLSDGTEVEKIPPDGAILARPVATAQLNGRHWLSAGWGIDYALARTRDGRVTRAIVSAGVRYRF